MTTDAQITPEESAWRAAYAARIESLGFERAHAEAAAAQAEYDPETAPEDSANDELSYWGDDGDCE